MMNIIYLVYRYLWIKSLKDKSQVVKRVVLSGGKVSPGNTKSKQIVKFILQLADKINMDPETKNYLKVLYIPNYNASKEHIVVPCGDVNEQIALPG